MTASLAQAEREALVEVASIAFGWVYGTELERRYSGQEPNDGQTPQSLWEAASEAERECIRSPMRAALDAALTALERQAPNMEAAAESIWNDVHRRLGGEWKFAPEGSKDQVRAIARAAIAAALIAEQSEVKS